MIDILLAPPASGKTAIEKFLKPSECKRLIHVTEYDKLSINDAEYFYNPSFAEHLRDSLLKNSVIRATAEYSVLMCSSDITLLWKYLNDMDINIYVIQPNPTLHDLLIHNSNKTVEHNIPIEVIRGYWETFALALLELTEHYPRNTQVFQPNTINDLTDTQREIAYAVKKRLMPAKQCPLCLRWLATFERYEVKCPRCDSLL